MAKILEYHNPAKNKYADGKHGYSLYASAYCAMTDDPICEYWHTDKAKAKNYIKRAMRVHTTRICKKRFRRTGRSYDPNIASMDW